MFFENMFSFMLKLPCPCIHFFREFPIDWRKKSVTWKTFTSLLCIFHNFFTRSRILGHVLRKSKIQVMRISERYNLRNSNHLLNEKNKKKMARKLGNCSVFEFSRQKKITFYLSCENRKRNLWILALKKFLAWKLKYLHFEFLARNFKCHNLF